jgi:hypothetical protein
VRAHTLSSLGRALRVRVEEWSATSAMLLARGRLQRPPESVGSAVMDADERDEDL